MVVNPAGRRFYTTDGSKILYHVSIGIRYSSEYPIIYDELKKTPPGVIRRVPSQLQNADVVISSHGLFQAGQTWRCRANQMPVPSNMWQANASGTTWQKDLDWVCKTDQKSNAKVRLKSKKCAGTLRISQGLQ